MIKRERERKISAQKKADFKRLLVKKKILRIYLKEFKQLKKGASHLTLPNITFLIYQEPQRMKKKNSSLC